MKKSFALVMAVALLAGSVAAALGGDAPSSPRNDSPRVGEESERRGRSRRHGNAGRRHTRRGFGDFERRNGGDSDFDGPDFGRHGPLLGGMGMGFGLGRFAALELTADQKVRLADVLTAHFRSGIEARMEMMEAGKKLDDLRNDKSASSDAIIQANAAIGAARGKMEALRRQVKGDMEAILTPEQLEKLDERRMAPPFPPRGHRQFGGRGPARRDFGDRPSSRR